MHLTFYLFFVVFPGGTVVKNLPSNAGDTGSIPGSGRAPGEGNDNPLQYSCLENSMDRGAWWATVQGVAKSQTQLKNKARTCWQRNALNSSGQASTAGEL